LTVSVFKAHMRKVATDRTRRRRLWLSTANHLTDKRHSFDTLKHHGYNRTKLHQIKGNIKRFLSATRYHMSNIFVVTVVVIPIRENHLCTNNFKATPLKPGQNFTD